MKRSTPQILIDRSKPAAYPFIYLFVDDAEVAFIARVLHVTDTTAFNQIVVDYNKAITCRLKEGGVVLTIEKFVHGEPENFARVKSLLKKALKKFLHGESERYFQSKDFSLDNQILQMKETIRRNKDHYSLLLERASGDRELADFNIKLTEATLYSLMELQDIKEGRK